MAIYECLDLKEKRREANIQSELPCFLCMNLDQVDAESVGYCRDCMQHMCAMCLLEHDEAFWRKPHYLILHFSCNDPKITSVFCQDHKKLCKKRCQKDPDNFDASVNRLVSTFEKNFKKGDEAQTIVANVKGLMDQVDRLCKSRMSPSYTPDHQATLEKTFLSVKSKMGTYFEELETMANKCLKEARVNGSKKK